jgi:hypothetical protein
MIDFEGRVYAFIGLVLVMVALILTGQMEQYNSLMTIALGLLAGIVLPTAGIAAIAKTVVKNDNE